ncbi:MAG TPA: hypothetical protein VHE30_18850 [Polyangiaceae bacterium]|nr:hypothetical protein [Polyangiaceae bacterium]
MTARRTLLATGLALVFLACKRTPSEAPAASSAPRDVSASSAVGSPFTALGPAIAAADLRVEARRGLLGGPDPLLAAHQAVVDQHFGGRTPYPLAFQVVSAGPGKTAVLLLATRGEARPLAFLLGPSGERVWTKEHPIGGVKPGVVEPSLLSGPDGHVCLAWCNGSTNSIALRRWAEDGSAFADYEAFHADGCEALSALYWPHHGFLLVAATRGGATAELVTDDGRRAFGPDGISLPWLYRAPAPVSLALDTEESFLLFRLGQSGGAGTGEYLFANRFSAEGRPLWPGPVSAKRLTAPAADPSQRIRLDPAPDGSVRATLAAAPGAPAVSVDVASDGAITRL